MFEANCMKDDPKSIVARVIDEQIPCFLTVREGMRAVLVPHDELFADFVDMHDRVLSARLRDLSISSADMASYCGQVCLSDERDAVRFMDEEGEPVLAMVGAEKMADWLSEGDEEVEEA